MHAMAFEPQPSAAPLKRETPPFLRRSSSLWINEGSDSESSDSSCEDFLPLSYDEEHCFDESASSSSCAKWQKTLLRFSLTVALLAASFYTGGANARRPLEHKLQEVEHKRTELLESQSRLLSEKAQLGRLPKANEELSQTIEKIKLELEEKERALKEEERRRALRDNEIVQIFGQFQLNSSDEHSDRQRREDLAKFIKTMAYDRYGAGTHEVEFNVRIMENGQELKESFVVEVAGFEVMPISSFLFLQQVEHGLWDSTSFVINAPHVLLADPISGSKEINRLPEMEAMGLGRLPVAEYSSEMPHAKYTLGFGSIAEAAGSYFFINTMDNIISHKGQSCFARIVRGFDVVDRITSLPTDSITFTFQPVDIVSVRLLKGANDATVQ